LSYTSIFSSDVSYDSDVNSSLFDIAIYPTYVNGELQEKDRVCIRGKMDADKSINYQLSASWEKGLLNSLVSNLTSGGVLKSISGDTMMAEFGIQTGKTGFTTRRTFTGANSPQFTVGMKIFNDGTQDGSAAFYKKINDLQQLVMPQITEGADGSKQTQDAVYEIFKSKQKKIKEKKIKKDKEVKTEEEAPISGLATASDAQLKKAGVTKRIGNVTKDSGIDITNAPSDFVLIVGNYFGINRGVMDSVQINYSVAKNAYGPVYCDVELQFSIMYTPKITLYDNGDPAKIDNIFVGSNQVADLMKLEGIE